MSRYQRDQHIMNMVREYFSCYSKDHENAGVDTSMMCDAVNHIIKKLGNYKHLSEKEIINIAC